MPNSDKDEQIKFLQESVNALACRLEVVEAHRDRLWEKVRDTNEIIHEFSVNFMDGDDRYATAVIASIRRRLL